MSKQEESKGNDQGDDDRGETVLEEKEEDQIEGAIVTQDENVGEKTEEKGKKEIVVEEEKNFGSFGFDNRILKAIKKAGYSKPTLVQSAGIPLALKGKDILARAKTGTGKTAAYILPILQQIVEEKNRENQRKSIRGLILVPSVELCQQVFDHCRKFTTYLPDISILHISRSLPMQVQKKRLAELPDLVISTPSQIVSHLKEQNIDFKADPSLGWLVLDEVSFLQNLFSESPLVPSSSLLPIFSSLLPTFSSLLPPRLPFLFPSS